MCHGHQWKTLDMWQGSDWNTIKKQLMSALEITLRSIKWAVRPMGSRQSIDQKIQKNTIFTLMKKGCMSYCFQVNSQRLKTSEDTVSMYFFLMFHSSLVIGHMRWKLKVLQIVPRPLRLQMRPINKPLKIKMRYFIAQWWSTKSWQPNTGHSVWKRGIASTKECI